MPKSVIESTYGAYTGKIVFENVFDEDTPELGDVVEAAHDTVHGENTSSDINEALEKGKTDKAKELINELVAEKVEQGKTEKEAKSAIRSSVTSYWKPLYLEAYRSNDSAEMLRIRKLLQATGLYESVPEACSNWIKNSKN